MQEEHERALAEVMQAERLVVEALAALRRAQEASPDAAQRRRISRAKGKLLEAGAEVKYAGKFARSLVRLSRIGS